MFHFFQRRALDLWNDQLHRNSLFLMASTGVMAGVGFFFWLIASRFYSPDAIGLGSSLISISGLLISISGFGLPTALIRFLPRSTRPNHKITTSLILSGCMAIIASICFFFITTLWLSELHPLIASPIAFCVYTSLIVIGTWQQIGNAVFVAKKSAQWIFLESIIFSAFKISLVYPLIFLSSFGLFISNFGGLAFATLISFLTLFKRFKVVLTGGINASIIGEIGKYSLGSYAVGLIGIIPAQVLPAMVAQTISAESAAHFFLALMMVNLISVVPLASSQVLFAAGSADPHLLKSLVVKSIRVQIGLVTISLIGVWLFSGWVFSFFGSAYAIETTAILKILSLAVIPVVISAPLATRLRIRKKLKKLAIINFVGTLTILSASYLGGKTGLMNLGWGYVFGQFVGCLVFLFDWKIYPFLNTKIKAWNKVYEKK